MSAAPGAAGSGAASDAVENSALAPILPHILRTFRREPALALTIAYLLVAMAGIYYDYWFYQQNFGIPVLTLSQISDFLVAGLQQPAALALVVLMLPICWVLDRISIRNNRKHAIKIGTLLASQRLTLLQKLRLHWGRWNLSAVNRWLSQLAYLILFFLYGWLFVAMFAGYRANVIKHGAGPQVVVRLNGEATDLRASASPTWSYLGAVSNYVFVYDPAARRAMILPVNAITRIQPGPVKGKPALPFPVVHLP